MPASYHFGACGPDWGVRWPSRLWQPSWLGWSIECFAMECGTSIEEHRSMRSNIVNAKSCS